MPCKPAFLPGNLLIVMPGLFLPDMPDAGWIAVISQ